jgi:hemolysin III
MSGLLWSHAPLNTRKARLVNEERANQVTHGLATALSIAGSAFLIREAAALGDLVVTYACVIYAITLTMVYLTSTLSHSFLSGKWKHSFRTLDQVSIFLLISGAFTPVGLTVCNTGYWFLIPITMWILSLTGVFLKLFVTGVQMVPVWFYVLIGCMPMLAAPVMIAWFPPAGLAWIAAGAAWLLVGTIFLCNDTKVPYFHCAWHLLVTAGCVCHFVVTYNYLLPSLQ